MTVYNFEATLLNNMVVSLKEYEGKVLLIVNTASKCGFTPQYEQLQTLYDRYKDEGLVVLGFPCNQFMGQEPGDSMEIDHFCKLNYGVTFPIFTKINVKGDDAHPLFHYMAERAPGVLGSKAIKWNFTKFLIDRQGHVVKRFSPQTKPFELEEDILKLL